MYGVLRETRTQPAFPEASSKRYNRPLLELKKFMARPAGCTFLGSKATQTPAGVNGIGLDILDVIVDSGSDITLISEKAWKQLTTHPRVHQGQKINLIQVTGATVINEFVKVDLYFETNKGPVQVNVDAYIVKGMSSPFILGNDFADQYSLSIIRREDTGREVELMENGKTFQVKSCLAASPGLTTTQMHRKMQKRRSRDRRRQNSGEKGLFSKIAMVERSGAHQTH
ncbi:hypothetical protein BDZ89DRAFT_1047325 [Hymenopellis radicata]|nr:hypothetical protein BDZ89DRAFT_1047325 [Hymenopellis radicata]